MGSVRLLNSRWLALAAAGSYLVVSAAVGLGLLLVPNTSSVGSATDAPEYLADHDARGLAPGTSGSAATARPAPAGFRYVSGPEEVRTVIPTDWPTASAGAPGAMRAVDPSDAGRIVGYGGAKSASTDLVTVHVAYEDRFAKRTTDYERIDLIRATYGGHPAVEWEFTHDDGHGTQHVRSLYWLVDGIEYFVFAAGPEPQWNRMQPIYDAMVANSRP